MSAAASGSPSAKATPVLPEIPPPRFLRCFPGSSGSAAGGGLDALALMFGALVETEKLPSPYRPVRWEDVTDSPRSARTAANDGKPSRQRRRMKRQFPDRK